MEDKIAFSYVIMHIYLSYVQAECSFLVLQTTVVINQLEESD